MKRLFIALFIALTTLSCNKDGVIRAEGGVPQITLDNPTAVYSVKVGNNITINPTYTYTDENTVYNWSIDGVTVCTEPQFTYKANISGQIYITIEVANTYGTDSEVIRVDVSDIEIPTITLAAPEQISFVVGSLYTFTTSLKQTSLKTDIVWTLNDKVVGDQRSYLFTAQSAGVYILTVTATNSDGTHSDSIEITVLNAEDMPFIWEFESDMLHGVVGREVIIKPAKVSGHQNVDYYWLSLNQPQDSSRENYYKYTPQTTGRHTIKANASTIIGSQTIATSLIFTLDVYEEGQFVRPATNSSASQCNKVYEYTPAPGQFIGDNYTASTPTEACEVALQRMQQGLYISLGGFGGYIVVGFDHSISNGEGYDFAVAGNSFDTSSEPGIVWVMQDENGDGKPNDTWYELAGSETGKEGTVRDYEVTYYRPNGARMDVLWVDNMGNSGTIDYLPTYHKQEYYYPQWIEADSYTLRGTLIKARNYDKYGNGAMWIQPPYDWGYADNYSSTDRLADGEGSENNAMPNGLNISNAIDHSGKSIKLDFIDFVKVQTACNTKSGWLGENSTEIFAIYSL